MDRPGMILLSDQFRTYAQTLSTFALQQLERTMQIAFGVLNLRNVQLWTRAGATQRNFINPNISSDDMAKRISFARALIEDRVPTFPVKIAEFDDFPDKNGEKLREYLSNEYTRNALSRVLINPDGSIGYEYDAYGFGFDDDIIDEDDLEEFR